MQWINIDQNTDEWMQLRAGRIGGSSMGKIMANYGRAFGPPANDLAVQIALEQIKKKSLESGFTNSHTERGHIEEPIARALYEDEFFCDVTNGGYFMDGDDIGVSPDGLVYDDGVIEIKCVIYSVQFATVKRGAHDPKYKWQLAHELKVSGREWIDYVSYCAEFPDGKRLFVQRLTPEDFKDEFLMMGLRLAEFRQLVNMKKKVIGGI